MAKTSNWSRRLFLKHTMAAAAGLSSGLHGFTRSVMAMGSGAFPEGVAKIAGRVRVNGRDAEIGTPVSPGDVVETGDNGMGVFVIDRFASLVRENTILAIEPAAEAPRAGRAVNRAFNLLQGKALMVFGGGRKKITTPTVVVGIRGSAAYLEADEEKTYFCLCYGKAEIVPVSAPDQRKTLYTRHHEAPRYIFADGNTEMIRPAPVLNHTDDELTMLESLVGRKPPFAKQPRDNY